MANTIDSTIKGLKDSIGNAIAATDLSAFKEISIADMDKSVKAITDQEVEIIIGKAESLTEKDYSALEFSIFDYVGFDPLLVSKVLKVYQQHYKTTDDDLLGDIKFSIAACLYMGNIQSKAMTRRNLEGRSKLEYLIRKYDIRTGSQGTGIPATALTFPRLAAAYPALAIRMADKLKPKTVHLDFISSLVPGCMRLTPFGSLCSILMDEELRIFLLEACNAHGSDMAIAFERGRLKKQKKELKYDPILIANDQWAFMEIASGSPVPGEQTKKLLLTQLNLSQYYVALSEVVKNYRSIMSKKDLSAVTVISEKEFNEKLGAYVTS